MSLKHNRRYNADTYFIRYINYRSADNYLAFTFPPHGKQTTAELTISGHVTSLMTSSTHFRRSSTATRSPGRRSRRCSWLTVETRTWDLSLTTPHTPTL